MPQFRTAERKTYKIFGGFAITNTLKIKHFKGKC